MKKERNNYPHTNLSDVHKCSLCGKGIKARLVFIKKTPPNYCYKCYKTKQQPVRSRT